MKRIFSISLIALSALIAALGVRSISGQSKQLRVTPLAPAANGESLIAAHLAGALRFRTVASAEQPSRNADQFQQLQLYLERTYPLLHAALRREKVGDNSLLYTWSGRDPRAKPIALMAHQDVVPVTAGTEHGWLDDPFGGVIRDGFVWGRGAWDNKGNLIAQMEAVEMLLASGFQPRQTVYLVLGDDEEVGGKRGARLMAALLKSRGVRLDYVLDEGLLITEGILPGIQKPVALIGVAEKGYASYRLRLDGIPGHSSMPPEKTIIGTMSGALLALESKKLPASIRGVPESMFSTLAPEMTGLARVMMSNLWLFKPLVEYKLAQGSSTNAMLRTTSAVTIFTSGDKDNVLPSRADATVNFRLLPGDTVAGIAEHIRKTINNDAITLTALDSNSEPSPVSSIDSVAYRSINRSLREVFPDIVVAPGLMIAATDSRYFSEIADNIYRFSPIRAGAADLQRFHGTNERLSINNLSDAIRFYRQLLANSSADGDIGRAGAQTADKAQ